MFEKLQAEETGEAAAYEAWLECREAELRDTIPAPPPDGCSDAAENL